MRPPAYQETGRHGGGHHGGGHHHGGHHHGGHRGGRGRGGGVVFYDRAPDVVVVDRDCPPGFYYDDFGNCRPLPYHSMNVGGLGRGAPRQAPFPTSRYRDAAGTEEETEEDDAGRYDMRRPTFDAAGDAAVPAGWFNPFNPYGSGYNLNMTRERNALNDSIVQTDARVAAATGKISQTVLADYLSFRKDWAVVNNEDIQVEQLNSMRARFRAQLDKLAPFMKVDDLRPPPPIGKQIASAIDAFTDSTKKAGDAAQIGIVGILVIAAVGLYIAAPHLLPFARQQAETGTALAKSFAK